MCRWSGRAKPLLPRLRCKPALYRVAAQLTLSAARTRACVRDAYDSEPFPTGAQRQGPGRSHGRLPILVSSPSSSSLEESSYIGSTTATLAQFSQGCVLPTPTRLSRHGRARSSCASLRQRIFLHCSMLHKSLRTRRPGIKVCAMEISYFASVI